MGFDSEKFINTSFKDRTADIKVPELSGFFDEEEKPVWTVRCLSAAEIARSNNEVSKNKDLMAIISSMMSNNSKEKAQAVAEAMGVSRDDIPTEIVKRISLLVSGSVSPECSEELAVKLSENYGTVFYRLTNQITDLTVKGRLGE